MLDDKKLSSEELDKVTGGRKSENRSIEFEDAWLSVGMDLFIVSGMKKTEIKAKWMDGNNTDAVTYLLGIKSKLDG